ncbi:Os01g0244500 [Oryza sativa Japonica Group]|mgnify:CR=1 FL=1|nr:hypothetical protein OsJ_32073 [Oryza sativa Japonica Group]BAS71298.1 Os01g0244500 [Oryza sativa Japonica Group]
MRLRFKTTVDISLAASMAYAAFGAAVAYPASAPAALARAFALGYGALLFLLPFSVYALEFLRPPYPIDRTPLSMITCATATPVALSVAVLTVLNQGRAGGDVAFAACVVWIADVAAVLSLAWCLTHGGTMGVALNRRGQYGEICKVQERMKKSNNHAAVDVRYAIRDAKIRFAVAVSAAVAVAGGVVIGGVSFKGLSYAAVFFALPTNLLYFRDTYAYPTDHMPKQLEWCYVSVPMAVMLLSRLMLAARQATTLDIRLVAVTAVMLAIDFTAIGFLEWHSRREMPKPRGTRASAAEIVTSFVMVCLRYWLYLHVFYVIGNGSQRWFN